MKIKIEAMLKIHKVIRIEIIMTMDSKRKEEKRNIAIIIILHPKTINSINLYRAEVKRKKCE